MEALLQLKGIDKAFPGVKALSGAALNVYPGRVMALVGENGAGKSTMMKVLTGIYARDAGTLLWLGKETTFTGPKSSQEAGIGIIHQELNLIPQLTIAENIFLGREFVNRFGKIDWKTMYAEADKLLAKLNLRFKSDKLVGDLSIGDQQMVEIAKVLSFESKVIIMDEPTVAVDPQSRNKILEGILELNRQGSTIIYTSHYMEEVEQICTRIAIIDHGRVLASGTTEELKKMIKTGETITIEAVALTKNNLADIRSLSHVFDLSYQDQTMILRCSGAKHNLIRVLNYLQEQDIPFGRVFSELPTLNDVFLEITGKELRD